MRTGLGLSETRLLLFWAAFSWASAFASSSSEEWSLLEPAAGPFVNAKMDPARYSNASVRAFGSGWSGRDLRIIMACAARYG